MNKGLKKYRRRRFQYIIRFCYVELPPYVFYGEHDERTFTDYIKHLKANIDYVPLNHNNYTLTDDEAIRIFTELNEDLMTYNRVHKDFI